jgi:hypothetical protein
MTHTMEKNTDYKAERQKRREEEALKLKREGHWACTYCTTHNENFRLKCGTCGRLKRPGQ